jgi:hypothetical protein
LIDFKQIDQSNISSRKTSLPENSPALQRWVFDSRQHESRRDERDVLPSLTGLGIFLNVRPSVKTLGYYQNLIAK